MKQNLTIHKKRLMATIIICLFSVITISSGKILINNMNIKNNIISDQEFLYTINQQIGQELSSSQYHEWLEVANTNSATFLKVNSINNNIKLQENYTFSKSNNLFTVSLSTVLANLISSAKTHLKDNILNK